MSSDQPSKSSDFTNFDQNQHEEIFSRYTAPKKSHFSNLANPPKGTKSEVEDDDYSPRRKSGQEYKTLNNSPNTVEAESQIEVIKVKPKRKNSEGSSEELSNTRGLSPNTIEAEIGARGSERRFDSSLDNNTSKNESLPEKPNNLPGELPHKMALSSSQSHTKFSHFKSYKESELEERGESQMQQSLSDKNIKRENTYAPIDVEIFTEKIDAQKEENLASEQSGCFGDAFNFSSSEEDSGIEDRVINEISKTNEVVPAQPVQDLSANEAEDEVEDKSKSNPSFTSAKPSQFSRAQNELNRKNTFNQNYIMDEPIEQSQGDGGFALLDINADELEEPANDFDDLFSSGDGASSGGGEEDEEEQHNIFDAYEKANPEEESQINFSQATEDVVDQVTNSIQSRVLMKKATFEVFPKDDSDETDNQDNTSVPHLNSAQT